MLKLTRCGFYTDLILGNDAGKGATSKYLGRRGINLKYETSEYLGGGTTIVEINLS